MLALRKPFARGLRSEGTAVIGRPWRSAIWLGMRIPMKTVAAGCERGLRRYRRSCALEYPGCMKKRKKENWRGAVGGTAVADGRTVNQAQTDFRVTRLIEDRRKMVIPLSLSCSQITLPVLHWQLPVPATPPVALFALSPSCPTCGLHRRGPQLHTRPSSWLDPFVLAKLVATVLVEERPDAVHPEVRHAVASVTRENDRIRQDRVSQRRPGFWSESALKIAKDTSTFRDVV